MDRKPDDEIGVLAAALGLIFVCATVWGVTVLVAVVATRVLSRLA